MSELKTFTDLLFEQEQEKEIISLFQKRSLLADLPEFQLVKELKRQLSEAENELNGKAEYIQFKIEEENLIGKLQKNNYNQSFESDFGNVKIRKAHEQLSWDTKLLDTEAKRNPELLRFKKTVPVAKSVSIEYL